MSSFHPLVIVLSIMICRSTYSFISVNSIARSSFSSVRIMTTTVSRFQLDMATDSIVSPFDAASASTLDDLVGQFDVGN